MPSSRCALLVASLLAVPALLPAQSIWISPLTGNADVDLEWTRPSFENNTGIGAFRGVWIATGRYHLGAHGALVVAVPRFTASGVSSFGNPYIGYQSAVDHGKSILSLGFRLPNISSGFTAEQDLALRADFDRFEEMLPKMLTIQAQAQGKVWQDSSGADVQARGGFTIFHPTDAASGNTNTFLFDYGIRFGRRFDQVDLGAGITGRYFMSGNGGTFNQRNATEGALDLAWHGPVTPRISFRIPVTETLKNEYKSVLTFGLEVPIP